MILGFDIFAGSSIFATQGVTPPPAYWNEICNRQLGGEWTNVNVPPGEYFTIGKADTEWTNIVLDESTLKEC